MTQQDDPQRWMVTDKEWGLLELTTVLYYLHETNPDNGLVRDKTDPSAPVSIAAVGYFGIDQGPVVLMVENYRTGLLWDIMRHCPPLLTGLHRAGFTGGWL